MKKFIILILPVLLFSFAFSNSCSAQTLLGNIDCIKSGECDLEAVEEVIINLAGIILAVTGSLSLLAFVIGGVMFLISSGSSEKIDQAKKIIKGAIIGMVIVFTSYTIISFVLKAFGINNVGVWQ